jgi:biotin carboxylase
MTGDRRRVVVLQQEQFIEVNLDRVFPPGEFEIVVFAIGRREKIWRDGVPHGSADLVRTTAAELRRAMGERGFEVAEVVTNDEMCVELVAQLREERGQLRRHPASLSLYRDKPLMKECLLRAGVSTPMYVAVIRGQEALAPRIELPVVVKPADGVNSRGVQVIRTETAFTEWLATGEGEWLVEKYIDGEHFHVNAIVRDGIIEHVTVGRYLSSLLDLKGARATGSISIPDSEPVAQDARSAAEAGLRALGIDGQFISHAELIRDSNGQMWMIEIAARAPGALVSEVAELAAGVHLVEASYRLQAGLPVPRPRRGATDAAWIWFPLADLSGDQIQRPAIASPYRLAVGAVPAPTKRIGLTVGAQALVWSDDHTQLEADVKHLADGHVFVA